MARLSPTQLKPDQESIKDYPEPAEPELLALIILGPALFALTIITLYGPHFPNYGDSEAYLQAAAAIRNWNFSSMATVQQFIGYPYAIALVSLAFRVPMFASLLLVSGMASLVSTILVARLFGTLVAAYFGLANFAWWQASLLGGSEPLAVALGMGAFWSFRRGHLLWAALLGALATTVRPLMVLTLVSMGIVLLCQRKFVKFVAALAVGVGIGVLYTFPLWRYVGDPFLTVHSYTSRDYGAAKIAGAHGHLFSWPFYAIVKGTLLYSAPWTNLTLSFFWIAIVLAGVAALLRKNVREYIRIHPAEGAFCFLYVLAIFCYGYLVWARGSFMRFSIPALPFIFYALRQWLPKDRRFLWLLAAVAPVIAACSAIGIRNISFFSIFH